MPIVKENSIALNNVNKAVLESPQDSEFAWANAELACSSEWILPAVRREIRQLPRGSIVVDLGCGNGSLLGHLQDFGFQLYGFDSSVSGLAQARNAYPEITFIQADLTSTFSTHWLAGRCDAIVSTEVIEHVFLPRLLAANCYRLLKPGGKLIISTPYHGYAKNLILALTGKLDSHFTALWDYGHIKFWSKRTLRKLLEEAGFVIEAFRGLGRLPFLWKTMIVLAKKPHAAALTTLYCEQPRSESERDSGSDSFKNG